MEDRETYIDAVRGFAIFLVVIGHLIQFNLPDFENCHVYNAIYSFHMPLFFFISGYVSKISLSRKPITTTKSLCRILLNKFVSIVFPSIIWTIITLHVLNLDIPLTNRISGYWFLNLLFIIEAVWIGAIFLSQRLLKDQTFLVTGAITILALLILIGIKRVTAMYFLLFVFGYFCCMTKGISRIPSPVVWVIALVFCYGAFSFTYSETDSRVLLELPTSICASILLFRIFKRFDYSKMTLWLSSIGKYTLGIYLTHFMLIKVPGIIGISQSILQLSILPLSIIIIFSCVLFQYCTCRSNILSALLFGKNWTSKWEK